MAWAGFIVAFIAFFVTHSLPVRPPLRPILVRALGPRGFGLAYGALSLGALTWLIIAAGQAPFVPLWSWAPWQNGVALILMGLSCIIFSLGLGRPNPFSFGGAQNYLFDPQRPGIVRLTRHPLLTALAVWALAHLIPNGDLAHVILFGVFAGFASFGGLLVDRRKRREMGQGWQMLKDDMGRQAHAVAFMSAPVSDALRIVVAGFVYVGLLWLHPRVIGVNPII
ncbi:NnrU family protein [Cognatiyoonia sp. IB215446]|uniref:NnrU family protein n=1 Tax=Cognatiyoonia sp. IB215446 TaxID=3097355 RepID=UPI002A0F298B|nr:NnrU family protein [Cognatiyoonia sp. IB215446]MDX8350686.1 NnrU family protein [Cognatiyoonia sp. IB215446]